MKDDDFRNMNPFDDYEGYSENMDYCNSSDNYCMRNGSPEYPCRAEWRSDSQNARYESDEGYFSEESSRDVSYYSLSGAGANVEGPRDSEEYVANERERELRRIYLSITNRVVKQYFPYKTLSVDREFDCFCNIISEELRADPRFSSEEDASLTDEQLKNLFFIVGGTLLGRFKPRRERLARLRELGIDPKIRPAVFESEEMKQDSGYFEPKTLDAYDERVDEYDEYEIDERSQLFDERRYSAERPRNGSFYSSDSIHDGYSEYDLNEDRRPINARVDIRRGDYNYNSSIEEDREVLNGRANASEYLSPSSMSSTRVEQRFSVPLRPDRSQGLRPFIGRNSFSQQSSDYNNLAGTTGFDRKEIANYFRRCLDAYFPQRLVTGEYDLVLLEIFLSFLCPDLKLDRKELPTYVSYAGGHYRSDNVQLYSKEEIERRNLPSRLKFEESLNEHQDKALLVEVFTFIENNFPSFLISPGSDGLERCYQKFNYLPRSVVDTLIVKAYGLVGKIIPTEAEAYVAIAQKVLRDHFCNYRFKRDFSDFDLFVGYFKKLAGVGAVPSESQLKEAFVKAGARFLTTSVDEDAPIEPTLSRSAIVKKIVASKFPSGLDKDSFEDLKQFRRAALEYNASFDDETDSRLLAIIERVCVEYEERLYSVPQKEKAELQKIIRDQFKSGARIIFYESLFEHEKDLLKKANIASSELLKVFLAKIYSKFWFYDEYLEPDQCDASDRVKVEKEILRIWKRAEDLKNGAEISHFVYVPYDRIDKALELNSELFYATNQMDEQGNVLYGRKKRSSISFEQLQALQDKWDEQYDLAFHSERVVDADERDDAGSGYYAPLLTDVECDQEERKIESSEELLDASDEEEKAEEVEEFVDSGVVWTAEAIALIKTRVDNWFDDGGVMIYVDALWEKCKTELAKLGLGEVDDVSLLRLLAKVYPNYYFAEEGYIAPQKDELSEVDKIKLELDRVWKADQAARRIVELVDLTYISKDALFDNVENLGVEKRSNGYLVRIPKRVEGARRVKRVLKPKRRSSKK